MSYGVFSCTIVDNLSHGVHDKYILEFADSKVIYELWIMRSAALVLNISYVHWRSDISRRVATKNPANSKVSSFRLIF